jgi:hypothetical protein
MKNQETRLRFQEPIDLDFAIVLASMAFCGVSLWIVLAVATPMALFAAFTDQER